MSCFESDSECVLAESRRGGNFRRYEPSKKLRHDPKFPQCTSEALPAATEFSDRNGDGNIPSFVEEAIDKELASELRNPSDALHILAQSEKPEPSEPCAVSVEEERDIHVHGESTATFLDEYELVQKGLVYPDNILDLLHLLVSLDKTEDHDVANLMPDILTIIILIVLLCQPIYSNHLCLTQFANQIFSFSRLF